MAVLVRAHRAALVRSAALVHPAALVNVAALAIAVIVAATAGLLVGGTSVAAHDVFAALLDLPGVETGAGLETDLAGGVADRTRGTDRTRRAVKRGEHAVARTLHGPFRASRLASCRRNASATNAGAGIAYDLGSQDPR